MKTVKKSAAVTNKTWLAGLGAYDSTREKAADKFDQLFVSGSTLVNELLEKGETVEAELQAKFEGRKMLQEKIAALKAKLGFGNAGRDQQIDMLSQRVDTLIDVVAKLAQQKAAEQKTPSPAASKATAAPTKKVAAKPVSKGSATKTPAKAAAKPAAKAKATKAPAKTTAAKPVAKGKKAPAKTAAKAPAKAPTAKEAAKTDGKDKSED